MSGSYVSSGDASKIVTFLAVILTDNLVSAMTTRTEGRSQISEHKLNFCRSGAKCYMDFVYLYSLADSVSIQIGWFHE
jgi:hypothetical protein